MKNPVWKMIKPSLKGVWYLHAISLLLAIFMTAANILQPVIYGRLVDQISNTLSRAVDVKTALNETSFLLIIWAVLFVTSFLTGAIKSYLGWFASNLVIRNFVDALYGKIIHLGVRWHQDSRPGEIMRRFDKAWDAIWNIQNSLVSSVIPSILSFIFVLGFGFYIHWQLTLVALIPIPLAIFVALFSYRKQEPLQDKINKDWEKIFSTTGDYLSNIVSIKTNTAESRTNRTIDRLYGNALEKQLRINKWWAVLTAGQEAFNVMARLLIFIFAIAFIVNGSLTLGELITFLGFTTYIYIPLQTVLGYELSRLTESYVGLKRVVPWWELTPEITDPDHPIKLNRVHGELEFKDVSFSYRKEDALKNISFSVPTGGTVALVGESGSGKSTTAALINRLYDPIKGSITIDGHDLREMSVKQLRSSIGYVLQENLLFHDTIMNNIRFAKPGASKDEVIAACKRAQAHNFISKLPQGYDSIVGERGVKLSGGEKQRIVIARTLLKDPPILVLDEATSALDSKTEHELQNALNEVMKDRTTIVIAHRLSTIMKADQILVFDNGKLVERGTHKQLSRFGKIYKELWNLQAGGYNP